MLTLKIALAIALLLCIVLGFELWLEHQRVLRLRWTLWDVQEWVDPIAAVTAELDFPQEQ